MKKLVPLLLLCFFPFSFSSAQTVCETAIHVAVSGADIGSCGSPDSPCATINFGINRAQAEGLTDLRVGMGTYSEPVVLVDGINLWGGFDTAAGWTKTPGDRSTLAGGFYSPNNQWITLKIENISLLTIVSDFVIEGPDASGDGLSSYAVHALNSSDVQIQNCEIKGGAGADGADGDNGTHASQETAPDGEDGIDGDSFTTFCNTTREPGGSGGVNPLTGNQNRGGAGGDGGSMDTSCGGFGCDDCSATPGGEGADGAGNTGFPWGNGGLGGGLCDPGIDGQNGRVRHGNGGQRGANNGQVSGNYWLATDAGNGTLGFHGGGGGGGGGAGGCDTGTDDKGASGGGGGAGGARAPLAGKGGQHGGSSFGIFAINSSLGLKLVDISGGTGGSGGDGGDGGLGQPGGQGGTGGLTGDSESGPAGDGGNGGAGGNSGGGAGGNGGSVILVFSSGSTIIREETTFNPGLSSAGSPGSGGLTYVSTDGQDGISGSVHQTQGGGIFGAALNNYEPPCLFQFLPLAQTAYCAGDEIEVNWQTTTTIDFINISLSLNGGSTFDLIAENILEDLGTYTFTLAEDLPASTQAVILLSDASLSGQEVNSELFTINDLKTTSDNVTICDGDSYEFGSQTLTTPGTYEETFIAANGCDSTVTLQLTVLPAYNLTVDREICSGDTYLFDGQELSSSGTYQATFTAGNGCDSMVTLNLTVVELLPDWNLEGDITTGIYAATGEVTASGSVGPSEEVTLISETRVLFTDGFHALPGSGLVARIISCSDEQARIVPAGMARTEKPDLPQQHLLLKAYPNPFRDALTLSYEIGEAGEIEISLLSLTGGLQRQLLPSQRQEPGSYQLNWDKLDLPPGIYWLRLRFGHTYKSIKVVSMR